STINTVCSFDQPPAPTPHTLSLHDALPIFGLGVALDVPPLLVGREEAPERDHGAGRRELGLGDAQFRAAPLTGQGRGRRGPGGQDRKSTRLNSSHDQISYAVFCLKKKKRQE